MTDETTAEQLAEIEGQGTEYTPPDGYRVLQVGEVIQRDDIFLAVNGEHWPAKRIGEKVNNNRYIRRIEVENCGFEGKILCEVSQSCAPCDSRDTCDTTTSEQLAEIEGQPQPLQVREGRWRTRGGEIKNIRACEPLKGAYYVWPWTDGFMTFQDNGRHQGSKESPNDLVEYLGPIDPVPQQVNDWPSVRDLRHELKTVQTQLGESRQRVTQLEELVGSLRNINVTQEKAFTAAGKENTALKNQLAAVKAELASVAADRQQLRVELDAAQQVPADSPEIRQLWANLAEVAHDRDTYKHAHELLVQDIDATHQRTKAETVEAIAEWLEPIRLVDSPNLANETLQHLPQIMRHLTGLDSHAID